MASTYSTNLALELIGTGDQSGTWGATTNTNLGTLLEQAIVGYTTQALAGAGPTAITIPNGATGVARNYVLEFTGSPTAGHTVTVPAVQKSYVLFNNTTVSIVVKVSGQTGVTIAVGKKAIVYNNGTDIIEVANAPVTEAGTQTLTNKTLTSPTIATPTITTSATAPLVIGGTAASSTLTLESTSGAGTTDSIIFKTGSQSTRMAIDTSGNVGIGTTSPNYKLDIQNTATTALRVYNSTATNGVLLTQDTSGNSGLNNQGNGYFLFGTNNTERMRIDASGNLLIGTTTSGNSKLYVNGSAAAAIVALTDAATIAVDMSTGNNFSVTLGGNRTLGNPTNLTPGQSGIIYVTQDATGSRTLAYSSYWKFPGGTAPTLTTTASAVDALVYTVRTSTSITVQSLLNIA